MAEKHGGTIWALTEAGKGSMFCFTKLDPGDSHTDFISVENMSWSQNGHNLLKRCERGLILNIFNIADPLEGLTLRIKKIKLEYREILLFRAFSF